uniref:Cuticle protein 16.5 n=1 Tax=Timema shepardi TaxID=629360 RepID=A0A7R9AYK0_TIMSH|nr:unnamed protein product [Timema shepardi]
MSVIILQTSSQHVQTDNECTRYVKLLTSWLVSSQVILSLAVAAVSAGYLGGPAVATYGAAPLAYAAPAYASYAAPVHAVAPVATSYANTYKAPPARLAYAAAPAYASYAAPAVVKAVSPLAYAAPAYASYAAPAYIH